MRRSIIVRLPSLVLPAGLLLLLASCASTNRDTRSQSPKVVLDKSQYEEVYVTGSNIPVLVPRGMTTAQALPPISPVKTMSAEAFRDATRPGRTPVRRLSGKDVAVAERASVSRFG
jgi:hypothetical protein